MFDGISQSPVDHKTGVRFQEDAVLDQQGPNSRIRLAGLKGDHAHRGFGDHILPQNVNIRAATEVVIEGFQFGELGGPPLFQFIRAGADGRCAVGLFAHLRVIFGLDNRCSRPAGQRGGVDRIHIDDDRIFVRRFHRTNAREFTGDGRTVVGVAVEVVGINDVLGGELCAVVELDSFVELEGIGQAVFGYIHRFCQHHLDFIELVDSHKRVVDVNDHHPFHRRAGVVRAEAGNFLMAHPRHCPALLGAARGRGRCFTGCRGFGGRGGFSAACGGRSRRGAGSHNGGSAAQRRIAQELAAAHPGHLQRTFRHWSHPF